MHDPFTLILLSSGVYSVFGHGGVVTDRAVKLIICVCVSRFKMVLTTESARLQDLIRCWSPIYSAVLCWTYDSPSIFLVSLEL